jgi:sialidase-1
VDACSGAADSKVEAATCMTRREFMRGSITITAAGFAGAENVRVKANTRSGATATALFEDIIVVPLLSNHTHRGISGSIVQLKDGSLLLATGNPRNEIHPSGIIGRISRDEGRTWGEPFSMQRNFARGETVCPSLVRLQDGRILFGYLTTNNYQGSDLRLYDGHFYVRYSSDDGRTWADPFCATLYPGFHTVNPNRVIQLRSGRIVVPAEWTREVGGGEAGHMVCLCYYTDDSYTWIRSRNFVDTGTTTEEPAVVELKDGQLLMVFRNLKGHVGKAYSHDRGDDWSEPGFFDLPSGLAPQYVTRIPKTGDLLLLWLNNPHAVGYARGEKQATVKVAQLDHEPLGAVRAPLSSAISRDEGQTWEHIRNITSDPQGDYGYQGVTFVRDVALVNYHALEGIHVTRIGIDWFYGK